ncbi:hypothetical protein GCM10023235_73970 [Kitasatospora terrestris]|uniref:Uncharacterized protein n=1 Tax=Kitasatospora terrestris TaxID=258051 RepID=A0ABP9EM14_9ACTN
MRAARGGGREAAAAADVAMGGCGGGDDGLGEAGGRQPFRCPAVVVDQPVGVDGGDRDRVLGAGGDRSGDLVQVVGEQGPPVARKQPAVELPVDEGADPGGSHAGIETERPTQRGRIFRPP